MQKKIGTVRYTIEQVKAKIAQGEDRTDWNLADEDDRDEVAGEPDWARAVLGIPGPRTT